MQDKINALEKYLQQLPQLIIRHSESVEKYVQATVDRLHLAAGKYSDIYQKFPMKEHAHLIGRYHDIGKAGISNALWNSPARFTDQEYRLAQTHTVIGAHMILPTLSLSDLCGESDLLGIMAECCLFHHERWDGTGYPFRVKGEQTPLYARIVALADCYDAMTEERPYKEKRTKESALEEIQRLKGLQFDPILADVFCEMIRSEESA